MVQCIITVLCNVHTLVGGIFYTVFYFIMQCSVQCSAPYSAVGWCEVEYHVYSMCRCTMCAGGVPYVHHSAQCCEVVHTVQCAPRSVVVRCSVHCAVCIVHCTKQCTAVCIKQCSVQCALSSAVVRGGVHCALQCALCSVHQEVQWCEVVYR